MILRRLFVCLLLALPLSCSSAEPDSVCQECNQAEGGAGGSAGDSASGTAGDSSSATGGSSAAAELPESCSVVDGETAAALVESDRAALVDVRTASEFSSGHLDGAINIPLSELSDRIDEVSDLEPVVVYCASGSRAAQATSLLCDAGVVVFNLGAMSNYPN